MAAGGAKDAPGEAVQDTGHTIYQQLTLLFEIEGGGSGWVCVGVPGQ